MKQTLDGDSSPTNGGEDATEAYVLVPKAWLDAMYAQLRQGRMAFDGETAEGKADRLAAAIYSLLGLSRLLEALDPADTQGYRAVAVESARGLSDLWKGNQTPDWLRVSKQWDRRTDAGEKWATRARVAIVFEWMRAAGILKKAAMEALSGLLEDHGLEAGPARVFNWVRAFRGGTPPAAALAFYRDRVANPPPPPPSAVAKKVLLRFLANELSHRGYPPGVAKKSR